MRKGRFASRSSADIVTLAEENPLAWIFLHDVQGPFATAAPVRPVVSEGLLEKFVGHVPRGWRIADCLASPREALILILGPHGYISPSWMSDRIQAPTWNFTAAQFVAEIELIDEPAFLEAHLRDLTSAMERGRSHAWRIDEMGPRLHKLAARIVTFEARVSSAQSRFKLGQDENDQTYPEILRGLAQEGRMHLMDWMRKFNESRS